MPDLSSTKIKKQDLRVIKTEKTLKAALYRLLSTTSYDKITVAALAREAQVSRKTFYDHYDSIDSLLEDLVRGEVNDVVAEAIEETRYASDERIFSSLAYSIMRAFHESYEIEANVLRHVSPERALRAVRDPLAKAICSERTRRGFANVEHSEYYLTCYLEILFGCYSQWREDGCKEPLEEVAGIATQIMLNGCRPVFERAHDRGKAEERFPQAPR